MKQGKRYLRNTVLGLYVATAAFVGLNRLHASTHATDSQRWHGLVTLGLREGTPDSQSRDFQDVDPALLKDFSEVSVAGDFNVEIVGSTGFKVGFTTAAGNQAKIRTNLTEGVLRVWGDDHALTGGTLVIETPSLSAIRARGLRKLAVRGLRAEKLSLTSNELDEISLEQNQVAQWNLVSYGDNPSRLYVDQATLTAGNLGLRGNVVIKAGNQSPAPK